MAIGGVVLQFKADADKARKDVNKLTRSIEGVGKESTSAGKKMSKLGKVGIAAVAAGAVVGAAALYDFAKAAAEDWKEAEKLGRTLKKIPGITDAMVDANAAWIDSMEIATGVADSDFREAIARLAVATGDLAKAQELAGLAADVAAGRNQTLASVVPLLEKAYGGNTLALKRQMPWLDANKDGTLTFKEAVEGLTDAYGGAAKAAADNDPWLRIQAVWSQMKESLGQFIIPFLEDLGAWFSDPANQKALQGWITKVGEFSREIGEKLVNYVKTTFIPFVENELIPAVQDVYGWFGSPEGQASLKTWGDALKTVGDAASATAGAFDDLVDAYGRLPQWFRSLQGKAFEFLGKASLPGALGGLAGEKPRPPLPKPTGGLNPVETRGIPTRNVSVTVINGKQEPALDSAALGLRLARRTGGFS